MKLTPTALAARSRTLANRTGFFVWQAAAIIAREGLAKLTLLGNPEKVKEAANGASLDGIEIIDVQNWIVNDESIQPKAEAE